MNIEEIPDNIDQDDRAQMLGWRLARLATEQVGIRQQIEDRWLADLEQYMGQYDATTLERIKRTNGSQAFINITRPKTTAAEARITDMLFPTDDRNWGIQPTPIPELDSLDISSQDIEAITKAAREKADAMAQEIDDQLVEAKYHQVARDVIHDGCLFGTGILKGPVVINRTRKQWNQVNGAVYELNIVQDFRPGVEHISIWDYFPDMSASKHEDCEFEFERRFVTKKQLQTLAKRPGYLADKIRQVIQEKPRIISSQGGTHIARLRELAGVNVSLDSNRYELWEYHGPVDTEDLIACGCEVDTDELKEHEVIVTFIGSTVIKADLNPLETGERPYSVFCFEEDDTSVFGFGIPRLIRNEQRIANAAWRMVLDNAALSTGPQIVVNREKIIPSDGAWDLKSRKVWWLVDPETKVEDCFRTYDISSHQQELMQIFESARNLGDDVTSLPMLAQGEQGDAPDTAKGTSMLMNAANVVLRRVIKRFDDVTKEFITRMYHWNMQNSDNEMIKGDYEIDARGSSVLLVKETQTQALLNLMAISQQPIYTDLTKHAELYRKAVQAQHLNPDDIIKTDDEIESAQNKPNPQQELLDIQKAEVQARIDKLKAEIVVRNIEGQYSVIQSAQAIAMNTDIIPIADELLASAGYIDHNGPPLAESVPAQPNMQPIPFPKNTNPLTPSNPQSPLVNMNRGIETLTGSDNL